MNVLQIVNGLWAIDSEHLNQIQAIYRARVANGHESRESIEARIGGPLRGPTKGYAMQGNVAVLPITGPISKRATLFSDISGGVSTSQVASDLRDALDDPNVATIVLDIDSPGGTVDGTGELADLVYASRAVKPIVSVANGMMASAAAWIGTNASKVYATSGSTVIGSLGVLQQHVDTSVAEANQGIKTTEITAGRFKRIASTHKPLTDEGHASIQDQVDQVYTVMMGSVARGRGTTPELVDSTMGQGRVFIGQQGIKAGLIDGIETLDSVVARAQAGDFANLVSASATAAIEELRMNIAAAPAKKNSALACAIAQALQEGAMSSTVSEPVAPLIPASQTRESVSPAAPAATATQTETPMDVNQIKTDHPDAARALVAEGHAAGIAEGRAAATAEARTAGATAERERIQGVLSAGLKGHKALVNTLAFDGKTTPGEAALQVIQAESTRVAKVGDAVKEDAEGLAKVGGGGAAPDKEEPKKAGAYVSSDVRALSQRAMLYKDKQKALGIDITIAAAVAFVEKNPEA